MGGEQFRFQIGCKFDYFFKRERSDWENMEIKNLNEKFYNKQFLYMLIYFMTLSF